MGYEQEPHTLEEAMARKNIAKLKDLAARIGCSTRSLSSWISGSHQPSAYYLGRLSHVLGTDVRRFLPAERQDAETISRRTFLTSVGAVSLAAAILPALPTKNVIGLSETILSGFAAITHQYRMLQRNGAVGIEEGLRGHITTITQTLELTVDDRTRRELWRLLAQAQLLARLNITKEYELGRAKTWNEAAIASAQQSGDPILLAAMIGHLAHLYLMWQRDTEAATSLLSEARSRVQAESSIDGWLALVSAAVAAREGNRSGTERLILHAETVAQNVPHPEQDADAFFTDFNATSVAAFGGNSLITVGEAVKASERLLGINLGEMAHNRHASTFYDIARAYASSGELEASEVYAKQAIDSAIATQRMYIVPRFLTLAQTIQAGDPSNEQARTIAEYAHLALAPH